MHDFDAEISEMAEAERVTYTRYADDLTFSARRTGYLNGIERELKRILREITSPSLSLNPSKTVMATRKYKRFVTGLVLTNDNKVSIGHERKRRIHAALYRESQGRLDYQQRARLAGLLAFVNDVEPAFLARLEEKYGPELIQELKKVRASGRIVDA